MGLEITFRIPYKRYAAKQVGEVSETDDNDQRDWL
jgi:hypothetical protein